MKEKLTLSMTVLPSMCDDTSRFGLENIVRLFMDVASVHAEQLGVGMTAMREKKFFWLTARTRVHITRAPRMLEPIEVNTWPMPLQVPSRSSPSPRTSITDAFSPSRS